METFVVPLDLEQALTAVESCPACGETGLEPVTDGDRINLRCRSCHDCWSFAFGTVTRVDPVGCIVCRYAPSCRAARAAGTGEATR